MLVTILFIVSAQLASTLSTNENEHFLQKRLHSLALLRGSRLYLAKDLQNSYADKGKRGWVPFSYPSEKAMNSYSNYYIPYFLDE